MQIFNRFTKENHTERRMSPIFMSYEAVSEVAMSNCRNVIAITIDCSVCMFDLFVRILGTNSLEKVFHQLFYWGWASLIMRLTYEA